MLTEPQDTSADRVIEHLNERRVPVFRADTAEFPQRLVLRATLDGEWVGTLANQQREADLATVRSVYYRRPTRFVFPDGMSGPERRFAALQARLGLGGVIASLPCLWINHPGRVADAEYKPVQLRLAARSGLHPGP